MTRIKICGLTREEDIRIVNSLRPDYIGFVFADFSKRYVTPERAAELKAKLDPDIKAVGVFVDENVEKVAEFLKKDIIDIAQLHGHEDEDYISKLRSLSDKPIIKVFNIKKIESFDVVEESSADYVMIDSGYGEGETYDRSGLRSIKRPFFLAGGLSPDNIEKAIEETSPYAVDVSSGVETDSVKDETKLREFISLVKRGKYYE
ncbi:MAG: phosphoribosylanthranilate isomerase [Eubacterium sp.]|nr:phosphoribosylanthranilate isomerase [Eubacterium sp.]